MTHKNNPLRHSVLLAGLLLWSLGAHSEQYTLPLFVTSTSTDAATGVVRILNGTSESGSVAIHAIDDTGTRSMTFTARDSDGDTDTLGFTITVSAGTPVAANRRPAAVSLPT